MNQLNIYWQHTMHFHLFLLESNFFMEFYLFYDFIMCRPGMGWDELPYKVNEHKLGLTDKQLQNLYQGQS